MALIELLLLLLLLLLLSLLSLLPQRYNVNFTTKFCIAIFCKPNFVFYTSYLERNNAEISSFGINGVGPPWGHVRWEPVVLQPWTAQLP